MLRGGQRARPGPEELPPHPTLSKSNDPSKPEGARVQHTATLNTARRMDMARTVRQRPLLGAPSRRGVRCNGSHRKPRPHDTPRWRGPDPDGWEKGQLRIQPPQGTPVAPQGGNMGVSRTNPLPIDSRGRISLLEILSYPFNVTVCLQGTPAGNFWINKNDHA